MKICFIKKIILFSFCFVTSSQASHVPDLFNGADEGIRKLAAEHKMPLDDYLLPSSRFMNIEVVRQLRFLGPFGRYQPDLNLPFQLQGLYEGDAKKVFPTDGRSSLLQCLFPCPDGVILLANQAYSDFLSHLTPPMMGGILRYVVGYNPEEINEFKENIFSIFFGKNPSNLISLELLGGKYFDFLRHDFLTNSVNFLMEYIDEYDEEINECDEAIELREILKSEYPLTGLAKTRDVKKIFGDSFKEGELEKHKNFMDMWVSTKQKKNKEDVRGTESSDQFEQQLLFEGHRNEFRAFSFIYALTKAMTEQTNLSQFPYAHQTVERTLMSYFWLKAMSHQDVSEFYGAYFNADPVKILPLFQKSFSREEYNALKGQQLSPEKVNFDSEILAAGAQGFQMFDSPLPPLIQFKTAHYKPKVGKSSLSGCSFPDCVETAIRNVLMVLSRRSHDDGGYVNDSKVLGLSEEILPYFETDPVGMFMQDAHDRWGSGVAEIKGVTYCKPSNNPNKRKFEVHSNILNNLKVFSSVFGAKGDKLAEAISKFEFDDIEKGLQNIMNSLAHLVSRKDFHVECGLYSYILDEEKKELFGNIVFRINGENTFVWALCSGHSYVKYFPLALNNWLEKVEFGKPAIELGPIALPYVPESQLKESLSKIPEEDLLNYIWAVDMGNRDALFSLLEVAVHKEERSTWDKFIPILLEKAKKLEDDSTNKGIANILLAALKANKNRLSIERFVKALKSFPSLLEISSQSTFKEVKDNGAVSIFTCVQSMFNNLMQLGYQEHILPLAQKKLKRLDLSKRIWAALKDQLLNFQRLERLFFIGNDGPDKDFVMEVLPFLPNKIELVVLNGIIDTTEGMIEAIRAYRERFDKIWIDLETGANPGIDKEAIKSFVETLDKSKDKEIWLGGDYYY